MRFVPALINILRSAHGTALEKTLACIAHMHVLIGCNRHNLPTTSQEEELGFDVV